VRTKRIFVVFASALALVGYFEPADAATPDYSKSVVVASENVATDITQSGIKVYLDTFRPNMDLYLNVGLHVNATLSTTDKTVVSVNYTNGTLQYHFRFGPYLTSAAKTNALATIKDSSGVTRIQIFGMPSDFPILSISGNNKALAGESFLASPTTTEGSYAIATKGVNTLFFNKSPRFIVGFRELNDSTATALPSGTPRYAYLEQVQLNHESLAPGIWKLLDSSFQIVGRVDTFATESQVVEPDGHGITVAPDGNPIVLATPSRTVDSSWLTKPYAGAIADCVVAEVNNGKVVHQFSLWDWANTHRSEAKTLLDNGLRDADPAQPNGPADICHANSIQYYAATNEYLLSSRSLSSLFILDSTLTTVKQVLTSPGSMQHFARFNSATEITDLGNYTNEKFSRFQKWTLSDNKWTLSEITLPIHVLYCGNAQLIDPTHLWVGGGCQAFEKNVLGVLYDVSTGTPKELSRLVVSSMGYSYRADLYHPN